MSQFHVGLACSDPKVLPYLATRVRESWCTILEEDGTYYWLSSRFESLATCEEVDTFSDALLPRLNGLVKLYLYNDSPLIKAGIITYRDEQGQLQKYRRFATAMLVTYNVSADATLVQNVERRWLKLMEMHLLEEEKSPLIADALRYYAQETTWHNLYDVYEIIQRDYNQSRGIIKPRCFVALPDSWTQDVTGKNREKDFTESANNFNLSGITARHPPLGSYPVVKVANSLIVKVIMPSSEKKATREKEVLPMSLNEAKIFIANLLTMWLMSYP